MTDKLSFEEYLAALSQVNKAANPLTPSREGTQLKMAADELSALDDLAAESIAKWAQQSPERTNALGIAVGLSQEKLKNVLKAEFGTSSWRQVAQTQPTDLVNFLDREYSLLQLLADQVHTQYDFGDILVARASGRRGASAAGAAGRAVEDQVEDIVRGLGLSRVSTRTQFRGQGRQSATCDVLVEDGNESPFAAIACKGFDSTGSKLSDAVGEIATMARVRLPRTSVYAVVDGIGWNSRQSDLRRIHDMWVRDEIDGLYTLNTVDDLRAAIELAAKRADLI